MSMHEFQNGDILFNTIKTYPTNEFFIYSSSVYYQNQNTITGANVSNVFGIPTGYLSLHRLNVDRVKADTGKVIGVSSSFESGRTNIKNYGVIYPYVVKSHEFSYNSTKFKTMSDSEFSRLQVGDVITSSYDLSASIRRFFFTSSYHTTMDSNNNAAINNNKDAYLTDKENAYNIRPLLTSSIVRAFQNALNRNAIFSPHYLYSASLAGGPNRDFDSCDINLLTIPTIFYGSSIKKGSLELDFYITGTLVAKLVDSKQNGELIQVSGTYASSNNGKVAGVVLYDHGAIFLTASWDLASITIDGSKPNWLKWAYGADDGNAATLQGLSASYGLTFKGVNYVHTNTYFTNLKRGELNWSNNPTFLEARSTNGLGFQTGSTLVIEPSGTIKNVVSSSFPNVSASFKKTTYVNRVNLYDEEGLLIGVAKLAKPIIKEEDRDYTIKIKVDA